MTTHTYAGVVDHTVDAGFRAWGSALSAGLQAAGLVQTADTGQINWVTVTRPSGNTAGGYEIYRLPDSSLYLKIEYGTGSGSTTPQMWVTVATGSNGSGTLTGQSTTRAISTAAVTPTSTVTNYTTYISVTNDHLSLCWAQNGASSSSVPLGVLIVGKTVDSSGVATTEGFGVIYNTSSTALSMQCVRLSSPANSYAASTVFSIVPLNITSSTIAGNQQSWHCWMSIPAMRPFLWAISYINSELADNNTISVAVVGSTARTYFAIGGPGGANSSQTYPLAMLYE